MRKPATAGAAAAEAAPSTGALPKATRSNNEQIGFGASGGKTVFEQMVARMTSLGPEALLLPHRVWKVKFVGEKSDSSSFSDALPSPTKTFCYYRGPRLQ